MPLCHTSEASSNPSDAQKNWIWKRESSKCFSCDIGSDFALTLVDDQIEEARASLDLFRSYEDKWEAVIESGAWPSALPPSSHMNYFS